jgi:CCR4-NOT transcription complex subunit 4
MDDSSDEEDLCPLCMEELDETDKNFRACQCGYQVCLWCFHKIRDTLDGKCPACRREYKDEIKIIDDVGREECVWEAGWKSMMMISSHMMLLQAYCP